MLPKMYTRKFHFSINQPGLSKRLLHTLGREIVFLFFLILQNLFDAIFIAQKRNSTSSTERGVKVRRRKIIFCFLIDVVDNPNGLLLEITFPRPAVRCAPSYKLSTCQNAIKNHSKVTFIGMVVFF